MSYCISVANITRIIKAQVLYLTVLWKILEELYILLYINKYFYMAILVIVDEARQADLLLLDIHRKSGEGWKYCAGMDGSYVCVYLYTVLPGSSLSST